MMNNKSKILWLTDTHTNSPLDKIRLLNVILDTKTKGVIHTGDITQTAFNLISDLEYIGKRIGRKFYFVIGNHPIWFSSFATIYSKVRALCQKYPNLVWLQDIDFIPLNEKTALCGVEGWYDGRVGNTDYLRYTLDWVLIKELRALPSMKARIEKFRELAEQSANQAVEKVEKALAQNYKTIYLATHYPISPEANRGHWLVEKFWEPYNANIILGEKLIKVMDNHKKRNLVVLSGHIHQSSTTITRNVECRVGQGSYYKLSEEEIFYI